MPPAKVLQPADNPDVDIVPLRFGVKYASDAPMLALEYRDKASGDLKLEEIPLDVQDDSKALEVYAALKESHSRFLAPYVVSVAQVVRLIQLAIDNRGKAPAQPPRGDVPIRTPPEAPPTGYMFGKGLYFADMVSKSANYCFASRDAPTGVLLLCDVALGEPHELIASQYEAAERSKARGKHSTWGVGKTCPDPAGRLSIPPGVSVPSGKGVPSQYPPTTSTGSRAREEAGAPSSSPPSG